MYRKSLAAIAAGAFIVAPIVTAAPAAANHGGYTPGCVTRSEFQRVDRSWTKQRVHNVFETSGRRTGFSFGGGDRDEWRDYRVCGGGSVSTNYDDYSHDQHDDQLRLYSKDIYTW
jgi:hypothetical protein